MRASLFSLALAIFLTSSAFAMAADAAKGEILYNSHCAICHGLSGAGLKGPTLIGAADRLTEDGVQTMILKGGTTMPAWEKTLSKEDVGNIISYLKSLKPETVYQETGVPKYWGLIVALAVVGGAIFLLRRTRG